MHNTQEPKKENVITISLPRGRRIGHIQQTVKRLDPNRRKYNRKRNKNKGVPDHE